MCITGGLTLKQEHYEARGKSLSEFFQCPQYIEIDKAAGLIDLAKIKAIKIRLHRDFSEGIKTVTIKKHRLRMMMCAY